MTIPSTMWIFFAMIFFAVALLFISALGGNVFDFAKVILGSLI